MHNTNKIYFVFFLAVFYFGFAKAQTNLVPNPSFEIYTACPSAPGQIYKAIGWNAFRESPDYFHSCGMSSLQVPNNSFGSQTAFSGNAYSGIITYYNGLLSREIIGIQLSSSLTVSQKYFISFMVNRGGNTSIVRYASNRLGVRFSTIQPSSVTINNWAHLSSSLTITDTLNWTKISGSFIADSVYKYIMIGNFFDDINTTIIDDGGSGVWAYYFIDNICVSTDSLLCSNPIGILEISEGINSYKIFPIPANDNIFIKSERDIFISIYNSYGKEMKFSKEVIDDLILIDCKEWTEGIYLIKTALGYRKIIINH